MAGVNQSDWNTLKPRVYNMHCRKKHYVTISIALLVILAAAGAGCRAITEPEIDYISFSDGDVFLTRDITIEWEGVYHQQFGDHWIRNDNLTYSYKLDNLLWVTTEELSMSFTNLNEGSHVLSLRAQFDGEIPGPPFNYNFSIDTIQGPGVVFAPRSVTDSAEIAVKFEDIQKIMSAHIEIVCEEGCADIENFIKNESVKRSGEYIVLVNLDNPSRLIIDLAFAGDPAGITGSPEFGSFMVMPKRSGKISIDPLTIRFKNIDNNDIGIDPKSLDWVSVEK